MHRTLDDIQDELLVLRCQDGDAEALSALIARWQPRLGGFAWRLTGEREAARDVVQESWLSIVRGLGRLDDPACFRTWAYRIVRNKCSDWIRRRTLRRTADETLVASSADAISDSTALEERDEIAQLRDGLGQLTSEQRAVLSLHYLDGMSIQAIAETLGVPAGTVKSRLFHARKQLKDVLERVER